MEIAVKYNSHKIQFTAFPVFTIHKVSKSICFDLHHSAGLKTIRPRIEIKMKPLSNIIFTFYTLICLKKLSTS